MPVVVVLEEAAIQPLSTFNTVVAVVEGCSGGALSCATHGF